MLMVCVFHHPFFILDSVCAVHPAIFRLAIVVCVIDASLFSQTQSPSKRVSSLHQDVTFPDFYATHADQKFIKEEQTNTGKESRKDHVDVLQKLEMKRKVKVLETCNVAVTLLCYYSVVHIQCYRMSVCLHTYLPV